jgi:uncharacterized protein (DUF1810 family)
MSDTRDAAREAIQQRLNNFVPGPPMNTPQQIANRRFIDAAPGDIRYLLSRITELEATLAEAYAQLQWVGECLEGQDVSEFAESFPLVRAVADLRATLARVTAEKLHNVMTLLARAHEAEAEVIALREALAQLVGEMREHAARIRRERVDVGGYVIWDVAADNLEAALTAGQPREPQP